MATTQGVPSTLALDVAAPLRWGVFAAKPPSLASLRLSVCYPCAWREARLSVSQAMKVIINKLTGETSGTRESCDVSKMTGLVSDVSNAISKRLTPDRNEEVAPGRDLRSIENGVDIAVAGIWATLPIGLIAFALNTKRPKVIDPVDAAKFMTKIGLVVRSNTKSS